MALKQNNFRDSLAVGRFYGATISNGSYPSAVFSTSHQVGAFRNIFAGEGDIDPLSSIPAGARAPVAWQLPQKAGGLASRNNAIVSLTPTGTAVRGLPGTGAATITFLATGTGGLIVSGSGSSTISFSSSATMISVASGAGTATVTFSPSASIGANAYLSGSTTISFTGNLQSYAIGYLSGTSSNETEFSAEALARAVWDAVAADFNNPGSMGERLNDAGSAGNPWASLLVDNNDPGSFGEFVQAITSGGGPVDIDTSLLATKAQVEAINKRLGSVNLDKDLMTLKMAIADGFARLIAAITRR